MKKITFFLMAWLCHLLSLSAQQDCTPDTLTFNTINLLRLDFPLLLFDFRGWENKQVILHDTLHLIFPTDFGERQSTFVQSGDFSEEAFPGDTVSVPLNLGDNEVKVGSGISLQSLKLFLTQNTPSTNGYGKGFTYSAPDEILNVSISGWTPPCVGAYSWAAGTCIGAYDFKKGF